MPLNSLSRSKNQISQTFNNKQAGFTLIEMLVAISVFAMLSVAGWQVFDGLTQTKNSTAIHTKALSELQYAYLQIHNDLNQNTAWQTKQNEFKQSDEQNGMENSTAAYTTSNFFELSSAHLSFIRFADPDPRYQISPTLIHVNYLVDGDKLIRQQHFSLNDTQQLGSTKNSLDSLLITGVTNITFEALNPEPISEYSSVKITENPQNNSNLDSASTNNTLLPKGVSIKFDYRDEPIEWIFALPTESPEINSNYQIPEDKKGDDSNQNNPDEPDENRDKDKTDKKEEKAK